MTGVSWESQSTSLPSIFGQLIPLRTKHRFHPYFSHTHPTMSSSVRAIHTFVAEHGDELEFQAGELIEVLERDDGFGDGWWRVSSLAASCLF